MKKKSKSNNTHKQYSSLKNTSNETHSMLYWALMGITVIFLVWSPFQRGLFNGYNADFDRAIYSSFIWVSILLCLSAFYFFFNYKYKDIRDFFAVYIWLIPLSFLISLINAASHYYSFNMLYMNVMYAAFFLLGVYLTRNKLGNIIIQSVLLYSGYFIVIFGILNWLGNLKLANALASVFVNLNGLPSYKHAVMSDSNGLRLTAVFQYANTYSAFLMAILFGSLFYVIKSRKWYSTFLHSFMLVPILVSFMLTLSRGGLVVLPFGLLILLLFFNVARQVIVLLYLALASIATLSIISPITKIGSDLQKQYSASLTLQGWGILLGVSFLLAAIVTLLQTYVHPWLEQKLLSYKTRFRYSQAILPVGAVILGSIGLFLLLADTGVSKLLPENISKRIENINFQQHSVLERITFYKDSLKVFKDYPLIGAGGGAWAALYEKYQNNPYVSKQAHNFFLQYLIEVGIIGFLIYISLLAMVFYFYIKTYIKYSQEEKDSRLLYFIIAISLLIHSVLDFNLSYAYLSIIVYISLGALVAGFESIKAPLANRFENFKPVVVRSYSGIILMISIVFLVIAIRLLTSNNLYYQAIALGQQAKPYTEVLGKIDKALDIQPSHPDYAYLKYNLLTQILEQIDNPDLEQAKVELIDHLKLAEPFHHLTYEAQIKNFLKERNFLGAYSVNNIGLKNFPWSIDIYEHRIMILFELGNEAIFSKKAVETDQYWDEAFEVYNIVLSKVKELEALPEGQLQGRKFEVTPPIALNIGKIYYLREQYSEASSILKQGLASKIEDQTDREIARWYLASLKQQGKNDEKLFRQLIEIEPDEAELLQKLVNK